MAAAHIAPLLPAMHRSSSLVPPQHLTPDTTLVRARASAASYRISHVLACVASAGGRACVAHSGSLTPLPAPPHRVDMAIVSHASSLTLPALRRVQTDGEARHVLSLHKVRPASALWPGEREIVAGIPTPLLAISPTSHALECSHVNVSVWIAPQRQFLFLFFSCFP